ncbi:MAG: right-handed parallel beta-helix repeat-containing protein [Methanosarcinaceae archaeon]
MTLKTMCTILLIIFSINCVSATTITVGTDNNNNFSSIQEAINFAQENDSILIYKGNYSETLTIDKQLRINSISLNPKDVIISPDISSQSIIHITSDNVEITGLTILGNNNETQMSGIYLDNISNSLIQNNIISNVQDGLVLNTSSENSINNNTLLSNILHGIYMINSTSNDFRNNLLIDNKAGLYLDMSNLNTLASNNASNNENYGVALRKSNNNNLSNNLFFMNKYGLCLSDSHENVIIDNIASNNKQYGFLLWTSMSNNIKNNVLIKNEHSGIFLQPACSNNTLNGNTLSNNVNGISIVSSGNNLIINNTFSSNKEYGIFYLYPNEANIKENILLDNIGLDDNLFSPPLIYVLLVLITGTGLAYYLKKKSLLKKTIIGFSILTVMSFIAIVAWYFPFQPTDPMNNVEITNFSWYNSSTINQTHTQGTLSMDINYMFKQALSKKFAENSQTNIIPAKIQISSGKYISENTSFIYGKDITVTYEKDITLTYQKPFKYETSLELESNMEHRIGVMIMFKEDLDYPHPYYGESRWNMLEIAATNIDLRGCIKRS